MTFFIYFPFPDTNDFDSVSTSLRFEKCGNRSCTNIGIVFDNVIEDTETFDITLERTIGLDERIFIGTEDGSVHILDVPSKYRNTVLSTTLCNIILIFQ